MFPYHAGLFSISSLVYLNLSRNNIEEMPYELGNLENLKQLSLASNGLSHLPASISRLTGLSELDISANSIKELPEPLSENLFPEPHWLHVIDSSLEDAILLFGSLFNSDCAQICSDVLEASAPA